MPRVPVSTGIELAYEAYGCGPPLLMLGGLGWHWVWFRNFGALSRGWRTVALDSRGLGDSDKPPGPYSVDVMALEAADAINALGLAPCPVLGLSLASDVAQELALSFPWLISRLILVGGRLGGAQQVWPAPAVLARMVPDRRLTAEQNLWRAVPNAFSPGYLELHPDEAQQMVYMSEKKPTPPHARLSLLAAGATWRGSYSRIRQLRAPALVCQGSADQLDPPSNGIALAANLPQGRLAIFSGAGHVCQIEQPEAFNALASEFLRL